MRPRKQIKLQFARPQSFRLSPNDDAGDMPEAGAEISWMKLGASLQSQFFTPIFLLKQAGNFSERIDLRTNNKDVWDVRASPIS